TLLRRQVLDVGDDPADGDDLAVAAALELGERRVGLGAQLGPDRGERMLRDVEAERLLLEPQELVLVELVARERRMVHGLRLVAEIEDGALPEAARLVAGAAGAERLVEHGEHRLPRAGQRAALDERLERALVDDRRVDALGEVPDRLERAAFLACPDGRAA